MAITINLNGETEQLEAGTSLAALLKRLELNPAIVSIGLNGSVVEKDRLELSVLNDGDAVEVLLFMGGGQ